MFDYMNESLSSQMRRVSKRTEKNKNKETKKNPHTTKTKWWARALCILRN